ncbi:MAG: sigma-70 family RNA polymerase sigma factor [Phycisphaerae bacterium]|nr:sigma-70 family RNA polymerase sigma factor [Phycisphaerae bacterium]
MTVPNNDQHLLAAACAGDSRALATLWERHRRWVAAVLLLHKPRQAEVDDLLQDVAATLVAKVGTLRDPETFPGWLRSVAINAARMAARGTRRRNAAVERFGREESPKDEAAAPTATPEGAAERLRARLAALPAAYAEPLLLRLVHDMPYAQIAQVLDLPETTVENRIVRGRRLLRDQVAADAELNDRYDPDASSNDE